MKKVFLCIINLYGFCLLAQLNIPGKLPFDSIIYLDKYKQNQVYHTSKDEKKGFLFFDMLTEPLAEVMFNGTKFVFNEKKLTLFPIYFSGQSVKKTIDVINSRVPSQILKSPDKSIFSEFNLTHYDFPLLVIYNEKNELCGLTKNVQGIPDIECEIEMVKLKVLRLKIMTEDKNNKTNPYAFKPVVILGSKNNDTIAKLVTNKYGDFNIEIPDLEQDFLITVIEKNKDINFVVLATQTGKLVGKFKSTGKGFEYSLLKVELTKLPDIAEEEDIEKKFSLKNINTVNNFDIIETLYYDLGETELTSSSKTVIDKVKKVLDLYPEYRLKVVSHTDSQGDDDSNLKLSLKRSQVVILYINSLGVSMDRLSAEGKGETEIRNRCLNNVDCSDKEHEFNRRTELKFYKIQ